MVSAISGPAVVVQFDSKCVDRLGKDFSHPLEMTDEIASLSSRTHSTSLRVNSERGLSELNQHRSDRSRAVPDRLELLDRGRSA